MRERNTCDNGRRAFMLKGAAVMTAVGLVPRGLVRKPRVHYDI